MAAGDIVIEADGAKVIGQRLHCQTWDLWLDSPDRRIVQGGVRRAMVHDFNDRLTINAYGDYPNGVQIVGQLVVDRLFVRGRCAFGNGITTPSVTVGQPVEPPLVTPGSLPPGEGTWGLSLVDAVQAVSDEVKGLRHKAAVFSPNGHLVATMADGNTAAVWDAKTGEQLHVLSGHQAPIASIAFSANSALIVTASDDRTARVWDSTTGKQVAILGPLNVPLISATFSPDGTRIATLSADGAPGLWDAATGKNIPWGIAIPSGPPGGPH